MLAAPEAGRLLEPASGTFELEDFVGLALFLGAVVADVDQSHVARDAGDVHDLSAGERGLLGLVLFPVDEEGVELPVGVICAAVVLIYLLRRSLTHFEMVLTRVEIKEFRLDFAND